MLNINKFSCLLTLISLTVFGCEKEITNNVHLSTEVIASFSAEGTRVAPARILFTNKSQNGKQFYWNFGNGSSSTAYQPGPVSYQTSGQYTITLVVSDTATARSDTAIVNLSIAPGGPYLTNLYLQTIWWTKSDNRPWDSDSTGPDIYAKLYTSDNRFLSSFSVHINIAYASMPIRWHYNQILPDERRDFRLIVLDNDPGVPQDTMAVFLFKQPDYVPQTADTIHSSVFLRRFDNSFAELELIWQWF